LAIQLLEKDQDEVLQAFGRDLASLLKVALSRHRNCKAEPLVIGFLRCLLILAGNPGDLNQLKNQLTNDQEYTAIDVLKLCGSLVGVTGSNHFGKSDLQSMLSALSRSNVLTDEDISTLGIAELISRLMTFLPIEFQSDEVVQLPLSYKLCAPPNLYLPGVQRSVRQRTRREREEPRVQLSACGLGRIFSSICCKFLGKLSNRGHVEL
jgi:hypothetical protein